MLLLGTLHLMDSRAAVESKLYLAEVGSDGIEVDSDGSFVLADLFGQSVSLSREMPYCNSGVFVLDSSADLLGALGGVQFR